MLCPHESHSTSTVLRTSRGAPVLPLARTSRVHRRGLHRVRPGLYGKTTFSPSSGELCMHAPIGNIEKKTATVCRLLLTAAIATLTALPALAQSKPFEPV